MAADQARDLNREALRAMGARDFASAEALLERAIALHPSEAGVWLNLAACRRGRGEAAGAIQAVEGALAQDPRNFMALLMKASLLEQQGRMKHAANAYGVALTQAPRDADLDPATLRAVQRAREINQQHVLELRDFLRGETAEAIGHCHGAEARRIEAFTEMTLGLRRNYPQQPTDFFYPGLPAIEFYERDAFPWLEALEAQTGAIRGELETALAESAERFTPYVEYVENVPLDQWAELNHSPRWSAFHLIKQGARVEENCRRCPLTLEAVERLPQPRLAGRSPAAMFSNLQPHTRIPPHTGVANIRLVVHLPLIVPAGCGFRVGNETREWKEGEAWVFDDTIEHEAWNQSADPRVILICDIWSPLISEAERAAIVRVMSASDQFNETVPSAGL